MKTLQSHEYRAARPMQQMLRDAIGVSPTPAGEVIDYNPADAWVSKYGATEFAPS